jgi:hypothetical protein
MQKITETPLEQSSYIIYNPSRGICICPENEVVRVLMFDKPLKWDGWNNKDEYLFGWVIGDIEVNTTEGRDIIQFTDIIKITI